MTITLEVTSEQDLAAYEFEIPCQVIGCPHEAIVSCKGCSDHHHALVCGAHLESTRARFRGTVRKICKGCNRQMHSFAEHYAVQLL